MKFISVFIFICLIVSGVSAQKISDKKGNVFELTEKAPAYVVVVITAQGAQVGTSDDGVYFFVNDAGKRVDLKTTAQVLNFMDKNGWNYINTIGGNGGAVPQMIFHKRE